MDHLEKMGWPFSTRCSGIAQLGIKVAGVAPPINHRTRTCTSYISAYMFEELWLLADYYLKCGRVLDAYGPEFMERDPYGEIICFSAGY